jgi:hypothetical protein
MVRKLSPAAIYFIVVVASVYVVWFVGCQPIIQYILENAISTFGGAHPSPLNGWLGVFFLPLLIALAIIGLTALILYARKKLKKNPTEKKSS